ncbi:ABC transporter permease [Acrocarpospora sp. B8E8]|uniref:ABC transporter permease n=1 Tax=Acrocarpospora sp. B8E8 TaxID=3153572 RepID=UPI00325F3A20
MSSPESVRGEGVATASSTAPPAQSAKPASWPRDPARRPGWLTDLSMLPALIVLVAVLSVLTDGMLTPSNIINVCSQSAVVAIAAIGATFVITAWGRRVLHVGANVEVARISGVHVARTKASVYAVAGLFSAIAGIVLTSGLAGAGAGMGGPLLLNIVGAVVLGGTSLFGGRGSLLRTAVGVLLLGFLSNGMSLLGLASFDQQIVTGAVIFIAASAAGIGRWLKRGSGNSSGNSYNGSASPGNRDRRVREAPIRSFPTD